MSENVSHLCLFRKSSWLIFCLLYSRSHFLFIFTSSYLIYSSCLFSQSCKFYNKQLFICFFIIPSNYSCKAAVIPTASLTNLIISVFLPIFLVSLHRYVNTIDLFKELTFHTFDFLLLRFYSLVLICSLMFIFILLTSNIIFAPNTHLDFLFFWGLETVRLF